MLIAGWRKGMVGHERGDATTGAVWLAALSALGQTHGKMEAAAVSRLF